MGRVWSVVHYVFFFQAEDGIRDRNVTGVQTCALPISLIGSCAIPTREMRGNVENPIGAAQVPLGIAGPLLVDGEHARGTFYVPLATTEGALVRDRKSVV